MTKTERLVKTKQRVTDHGEVFTPECLVEAMLDTVSEESVRIDSRFLEPACGEGNFLRQVLIRKLSTVEARYGKSEFERNHFALLGLMCIYGIELLEDNVEICRDNLGEIFDAFIGQGADDSWSRAAKVVLEANIVQADALTMKRGDGLSVVFPEWGYLGRGKFQRRDFEYSNLLQQSAFAGTLFDGMGTDEIFAPKGDYKPMSVSEIANLETK